MLDVFYDIKGSAVAEHLEFLDSNFNNILLSLSVKRFFPYYLLRTCRVVKFCLIMTEKLEA